MPAFNPVPERYDFPAAEAEVRQFWKEQDVFQKSLALREGAETFVFYEGPPTANGKPHPGHVLTRVVKDIFPRYKTMRGFRVPRKAGWDTHGLPVEVEVEKALGISGKEAIEEFGVEQFCKKCLESVFVYTKEWEELTESIGFWVDLSEAYVTFHQSYVESVWWSLKQLFDRDLLYEDRKIVWWWPQGGTTLSQAEVGQGYREVDDPSVYVRFRDAGEDDLSYLAWTTTPWTLPSNVALAVKADAEYVTVTLPLEDGEERVVMAAPMVAKVLGGKGKKKKDAVEPVAISEPYPGSQLVGKAYQQLLPYKDPEGGKAFEIVAADFVEIAGGDDGIGTGLVHIAPAFGEDDYRVAREQELGFLQLVDDQGNMTAEVTEFAGEFCKSADRGIIRLLRERGLLFREEVYRHDYPFCWRASDDPLIQYARPAWFIGTSGFRDDLVENNQAIKWVPEHIRDGRMGKFLANNIDWALSRERYWGTPLPVWRCETSGHLEAIACYDELLSKPDVQGTEVWDAAKAADPELPDHLKVHKPYIDAVTYESPKDSGARMRRVKEVIDCWYDAGAMPLAQWGYPHVEGSDKKVKEAFPADFISEAIDQTRGWFNALICESTLLQQDRNDLPHPFKACIVLGHVCDDKGRKMSKSLGNYLPPSEVIATHGADALRWSFVSQGHPWTNIRFSLDRVAEAKKEFLIRLQNVYSFFVIYANIDGFDPAADNPGATDVGPETLAKCKGFSPVAGRPLMDRWILSELQLCAGMVTAALDEYDILPASRALFDFVDRLSNWYVRGNRRRFWGSGLDQDKYDAYWTLYESLVTMSRLAAPFIPFFAETLHRNLVVAPFGDSQTESVHLTDFPEPRADLIDEDLSSRMATILDLVALGRSARVDAKQRVRQPLREAVVVLADSAAEEKLADLLPLAQVELNVKRFVFATDASQYVDYLLKPNFKLIGPRLGQKVQKLKAALADADGAALLASIEESGSCKIDVDGETIELSKDEIEIQLLPKEGYAAKASGGMVVVLDTQIDDALTREWQAREVVAAVNGLRGKRGLEYEARIRLSVWASDAICAAVEEHAEYVQGETLATSMELRPLAEAPEADAMDSAKALPGSAGDEGFVVEFRVEG